MTDRWSDKSLATSSSSWHLLVVGLYLAVSEDVVLKVDVLDPGRWTSVRIWASFTRVKLWWLDDWVRASPKLQFLWGFSGLQWSVVTVMNRRQGYGQPRLTCVVQSNRLATVAQIAQEVNGGCDRRVSEYTEHHSLLSIRAEEPQTNRDAHADPCPPSKASTMGTWESKPDKGAKEEGGWVWWFMFLFVVFFFKSCGGPDAYVSLSWETHGTKKHYRKKASKAVWCLPGFLQGNLGSFHPFGCNFETYHLCKHCCRPCTPF